MLQVTCLFGIVIFAMYEADLTTRMTVKPTDVPLRSFTDVYNSGKKLILRTGTAQVSLLRNANKGTGLNTIYKHIEDWQYITDPNCDNECMGEHLRVRPGLS